MPETDKKEVWKNIDSLSPISVGDWLYYIDDNYFGKVEKIENGIVWLCIQNFRVHGSSYIAKISDIKKLKVPASNICIDWQIAERYPTLYETLNKSFFIWSKLEPFILSLPIEKRAMITPEPFYSVGRILGKWMSKGYLSLFDIETLELQKFSMKIHAWKKLDDAISEEMGDDLLIHFDDIRKLSFANALELSEKTKYHCLNGQLYERDILYKIVHASINKSTLAQNSYSGS